MILTLRSPANQGLAALSRNILLKTFTGYVSLSQFHTPLRALPAVVFHISQLHSSPYNSCWCLEKPLEWAICASFLILFCTVLVTFFSVGMYMCVYTHTYKDFVVLKMTHSPRSTIDILLYFSNRYSWLINTTPVNKLFISHCPEILLSPQLLLPRKCLPLHWPAGKTCKTAFNTSPSQDFNQH